MSMASTSSSSTPTRSPTPSAQRDRAADLARLNASFHDLNSRIHAHDVSEANATRHLYTELSSVLRDLGALYMPSSFGRHAAAQQPPADSTATSSSSDPIIPPLPSSSDSHMASTSEPIIPPLPSSSSNPSTAAEPPSNSEVPSIPPGLSEYADRELSDYDILQLTQQLKDAEAEKRPLIAATVPLTVLKSEYASPIVRAKIDWLSTPSNAKNTNKSQGWTGLRRTRGDGDCFYRSVAFSYVERILEARDQELAAASSLSTLDGWLMNLESVGFERGAFEDFYDALREIITNVFQADETGSVLTPISLLERFQDPYISNSIVTFLRLLTSAYMRLNADDFAPFLLDPETFEQIDLVSFCSSQVECMGKEADHVQIQALTRALRIPVDIAYMDGNAALAAGANVSAGGDEIGKVDFVRFEVDGPAGSGDGAEPVTLLYRPGHYDILEKKDVLPLEGFVRERSIPFP